MMNSRRHPKDSMSGPPATTAITGDIASTEVYRPMALARSSRTKVAAMSPNAEVLVAAPDICPIVRIAMSDAAFHASDVRSAVTATPMKPMMNVRRCP